MPDRVEVIYFPKRTRAPQRRGTLEAATLDASSARTIEFQPTFEDPEPSPQQQLDELLRSASPGKLSPREVAELTAFGHRLFESGRLQDAQRVFEALIGLNPADAFSHTMLGTVLLALGVPESALAHFESALKIDPGELAARVYRAEIRIGLGRTTAARQDLERVVREGHPEDPFVERARRLQQILGRRQKRRRNAPK